MNNIYIIYLSGWIVTTVWYRIMKLFKRIALAISGLLLGLSTLSFTHNNLSSASAESPITISNVQVRGAENAEHFKFVVLISDLFNGKATKEITNITSYNTTSKISIYTSENSTPVLLSSITENFCQQNFWAQPGLFINISDANYEIYNATTIYKLVISKDCEIPVDETKYVTTKAQAFINGNYGNASAKYESFSWAEEQVYEPGTAHVDNVQLRGDNNIYFGIVDNQYSTLPSSTTCVDVNKFNVLDKVIFYMSGNDTTGVSLKTLSHATSWQENMWASSALMIKIDDDKINTYNGSTVYAIEILPDCHIPCGSKDLVISSGIFYVNSHLNDENYKFSNFYWTLSKHYINVETNISGIQIRGDADAEEYYFVIQNERYASITQGTQVIDELVFDVLTKVKFYLSKEDTEGTLLANIVDNSSHWIINKWSSGGIMFKLNKNLYVSVNGQTVFAVELLENITVPCGDNKLTLTNAVKFYNNQYGKEEAKYSAFDWGLTEPYEPQIIDTNVSGVQMRGDADNRVYYCCIQTEEYIEATPGDFSFDKDQFDVLEKVRVYSNSEDKVGVKLSTIVDESKSWAMNLWECHGLLIPLTEQGFEQYNGASTYGISVEKDTKLPMGRDTLVIQEEKFFANTCFNNNEFKYNGFYFSEAPKEIKNFGITEVTRLQNRANNAARWLMVSVSTAFEKYALVSTLVDRLNMLDMINIYYSKDSEPIKLKDIYIGICENYLFNESTTLGIRINLDEANIGPNMYKVEFKKGCQIPYIINGEYGYKTLSSDYLLVNNNYQRTGDIFGIYDEDGFNRTYEQWCVNWSFKALVKFVVEGIDDLAYDDIEVTLGSYVDLNKYNVEGYDLMIESSTGNYIYQGFYPDVSGIVITLKYTKSKAEDKPEETNTGCSGSLIISGVAISLISLLSIAFFLKRKELVK